VAAGLRPFPQNWATQGFIDEFMRVNQQLLNRRFCFILGSGASKTSGVPTGAELVDRWLPMLQRKHDPKHVSRKIEDWATETNLGIPKFTYEKRAEFYAQVFHATFGHNFETGYGELEQLIEKARPRVGYSVLAQILAQTRHCVVITTNFDNCVADALATYTDKLPLILGHEALAGFAQVEPRRPLIVKVHHDLLLNPKNTPAEIGQLSEGWRTALCALFSRYTPIVLGYGGNDDGFMNFLANDKSCCMPQGNMFWLHRIKGGPPKHERIRKVMARHKGVFVPCVGFDEIMSQLRAALGYPLLADEIEKKARERAKEYREQIEEVQKRLKEADEQAEESAAVAEVKKAVGKTIAQATRKDDWWAWELKAQQEKDPGKREAIYRQGLAELPNSVELTCNFANFLRIIRKNYDEAERLYRHALALGPNEAIVTGSYASFLWRIHKNYDEAERLYRRALELDANDVNHTGNYAGFLADIRKNYDEAERLYRRALELDVNDANHTGNYATFLHQIRKNYDEAERLYRRALELDANHAYITVNFACFLLERQRWDEAAAMAERAWTLGAGTPGQARAEAGLYRSLLAAAAKADFEPRLGQLKSLLQSGFEREQWSFDNALAACAPKLNPEQQKLFRAVADAILDESKLPTLESMPEWQRIPPVKPSP
jgi:Tfp pilus assembly protein PilF